MHIPTHQIHNVLNAYAKRLKKMHDAANGAIANKPEDLLNAYSVEDKHRFITNKISANIIDKIIRSKPLPRPVDSKITINDPSPHQSKSQSHSQTELIRYHTLTKNGKKVSAEMKISDSDFLIKQLQKIARNASEK